MNCKYCSVSFETIVRLCLKDYLIKDLINIIFDYYGIYKRQVENLNSQSLQERTTSCYTNIQVLDMKVNPEKTYNVFFNAECRGVGYVECNSHSIKVPNTDEWMGISNSEIISKCSIITVCFRASCHFDRSIDIRNVNVNVIEI
jgi:hypothetical protein